MFPSSSKFFGALALLSLTACGKKGPCGDREVVATISGNHGHEIRVEPGRASKGFPVEGGSHEHAVILSEANLEALRAQKPATTRTTSVHGHLHEVTFACAP